MNNILNIFDLQVKKYGYSSIHKNLIDSFCEHIFYLQPSEYEIGVIEFINNIKLKGSHLKNILAYLHQSDESFEIINFLIESLNYESLKKIILTLCTKWPEDAHYLKDIHNLSEIFWLCNSHDTINEYSFQKFVQKFYNILDIKKANIITFYKK